MNPNPTGQGGESYRHKTADFWYTTVGPSQAPLRVEGGYPRGRGAGEKKNQKTKTSRIAKGLKVRPSQPAYKAKARRTKSGSLRAAAARWHQKPANGPERAAFRFGPGLAFCLGAYSQSRKASRRFPTGSRAERPAPAWLSGSPKVEEDSSSSIQFIKAPKLGSGNFSRTHGI